MGSKSVHRAGGKNEGRVLAIVGPTASGKTLLSMLVAERLGAEIVSADSRQIYKFLDIGTAKPSKEQRSRVVHHFVDILDPRETSSAGQYGKDARTTIERLLKAKKSPVLVGGSGLYVKAVVDGLFGGPGKDDEIRARLEEEFRRDGIQKLLKKLREVDPESADVMGLEPKPRRIVRALEVYAITGKPISEFHKEQETKPSFETVLFGLLWNRKDLYRRIDERVDRMVQEGFVEEVEQLQKGGYDSSLNSLQTVGYKEMFQFLRGEISLQEAVDRIKRNTRRFAKRQLTWFRADRRIRWIQVDDKSEFRSMAEAVLREFGLAHLRGE